MNDKTMSVATTPQQQQQQSLVSVDAFNTLLMQFADELELTFDDEPSIATWNLGLKSMIGLDKGRPVQMFTQHVAPFTQRIMAKDPTLLSEMPKVLGGVDIHKLYQSASEETQEAIWGFLMSLTMLSVAITNLPPELMATIEQAVGQMATANPSEMQEVMGTLGGGMGGLGGLGGLMGMLGGGGLGSLLGALQPPK